MALDICIPWATLVAVRVRKPVVSRDWINALKDRAGRRMPKTSTQTAIKTTTVLYDVPQQLRTP